RLDRELRLPVRSEARRAGPGRVRGHGQEGSPRLHDVEGRQAGRARVGYAVGPGTPGLAHRVLRDGNELPGRGARHTRRRLDLQFPHHENEAAQATAAGDGFAQYWMHNGWVTMSGEKMSKSLGNVLSVPNILEKVRP